jgi:hypothetical protein
MPHKYNANRRHRIPRPRYKVTNWRDDEAGLRQRGSLVIWFSAEAVAAWRAAPRTTPGGQARYSDVAIETSLILRAVFHQPLRQAEVLVGSLLGLMRLDLPVPDHSTLSRRARTLAVAPQVRTTSGPVHLLVDSTRVKLSGPGECCREAWNPAPPRLEEAAPGRRCENRHDRRLDPDQQGGRRCRQTRIPTECSTLDARNLSAPPNNQGRTAVLRSSPPCTRAGQCLTSTNSVYVFVSERTTPLTPSARSSPGPVSPPASGFPSTRTCCDRLQAGQGRTGYPLDSALPRSPEHPAHHPLHSAVSRPVQRFLD